MKNNICPGSGTLTCQIKQLHYDFSRLIDEVAEEIGIYKFLYWIVNKVEG